MDPLYRHMEQMAGLLNNLLVKSMTAGLGPAEGDLYMQLCNALEEWSRLLEKNLNVANSTVNPTTHTTGDPEPKGNPPPS